jgi:RHS repeat-associated protein
VNQLTEIKSVTGSTTVSRYAYDYNALNQRSKATLADNGYWSYDYNTKGEVINGTRKDANGNAISGQNFGYDFDGIGNRLTTSIDGATESSYTANALNQYTAFNSNSLTYDDDGNLTNDGLRQFTYNGENRLLQVRDLNNTLIATYTYDDQGRRVRKVTTALAPQGAQDLIFLWDGWNTAAQLTYQLTNAYQLAQAYTWGLDIGGTLQGMGGVGGLILEKDVMAGAYFPSFDGGGNLVNLIRASAGTIEAAYAYDPFGKVTVSSGPYADKNSWMYSSKFTDIESGLLIFQLRHSDPHLGRWISRDPEQEVGGENLYAFVGNDPVNKFDALGLSPGDAYDTVDAAVKAALDEAANATAQTVSRGQSEYAKKRGGHTYPEYGQYYKTGITSAPDYTHYRVFGIEYASFVYEFSDSGGTKYSYSALIKGQIPHDPASLGEVDIGKWNDQMAGQNKSKVCCPKAAVHTHTVDVKYEDGRVDNGSEFSEGDKTWAKNNKLPLWLRDATGADRKYE